MKLKTILCSSLIAGLAFLVAGCETEREGKGDSSKLEAMAKVNRAEAEKTALAKVPGGTVKEGELEKEKGKVVWSFDIATPGTSDITEVQVDAQTGEIVSVAKESAAHEAREKKKEGKEDDKK